MAHGQFRKGWRESDVEDCARMMVSSLTNSIRKCTEIRICVMSCHANTEGALGAL